MRLSIIVNNYNYDAFLKDSIDSALAVRWFDKEVIVVDDGSTDGSRETISAYGDRIISIFKPNGGQNDAVNAAFAQSTGEAILILDADDMLLPTVAEAALTHWSKNAAVVQYGMRYMARDGKPSDIVWPLFTEDDTPERVKETFLSTGYYDAPATSANIWSRKFLTEIGPLPTRDSDGLGYFDDYLHLLAPFFGDVVCLPSAQALYRIHGKNVGYTAGFSPDAAAKTCRLDLLRLRLVDETLTRTRHTSLRRLGVSWDHSIEHMSDRLIHKRFRPDTYPLQEGLGTVLSKYLGAARRSSKTPKQKALCAAWGIVMAVSPRSIAFRAGDFRARRALNDPRAQAWSALSD
jgi:glycosyltransferase involved in cell wall biosynthesis